MAIASDLFKGLFSEKAGSKLVSSAKYDVVIVGGSLAAITCAEALRGEGFEGTILVISGENHLPYNRPPLSKQVLLGKWDVSQTAIHSKDKFEELSIEFLLGRKASELNLESKTVKVQSDTFSYSKLVIATGVSPRELNLTQGYERVHSLRTIDDVIAIRHHLESSKRVAMIGAGVLGCEISSALSQMGHEVSLIERLSAPQIPNSGGHLAEKIIQEFIAHGVDLNFGTNVQKVLEEISGFLIELDNRKSLAADIVIVSIGSVPNTRWLQGSGIDVSDGVLCDANGQAGPDVFAIGDVARWVLKSDLPSRRRENQTSAIDQALAVAKYIARGEISPLAQSFFWSEIFGKKILILGHLDPDPDSYRLVQGDLEGDKFIIATEVRGSYTGVLSWNMPREFREARSLIE